MKTSIECRERFYWWHWRGSNSPEFDRKQKKRNGLDCSYWLCLSDIENMNILNINVDTTLPDIFCTPYISQLWNFISRSQHRKLKVFRVHTVNQRNVNHMNIMKKKTLKSCLIRVSTDPKFLKNPEKNQDSHKKP